MLLFAIIFIVFSLFAFGAEGIDNIGVDSASKTDVCALLVLAVVLMVIVTGLCLKRSKNSTKEDDPVSQGEKALYDYVSTNVSRNNVAGSPYSTAQMLCSDGEYLDMSYDKMNPKEITEDGYVTMNHYKPMRVLGACPNTM